MQLSRREDRSALTRYLTEIHGRSLITREEEARLARRSHAGSRDATNALVESHLGFVVKVASGYRNMGLPFEDLINEGNLGLLEAARRYDAARGTRFITFAVWWIRKSIRSALTRGACLVHVPDSHHRKLRRIRDAEESLSLRLGRPPEREELARAVSQSRARLEDALRRDLRTSSLADPGPSKCDAPLQERLTDGATPSVEMELLHREATDLVAQALERLCPKERWVLEHRFGLTDGPGLVLREVGQRLGVSRERVRQIEAQAMRRLRSYLERRLSAAPHRPDGISIRRCGREARR